MRITFLGTGTSQGIPVIACPCAVCNSNHQHDKRLRVSVLIETGHETLVIDTGPDFRQQMLTHRVKRLDAVLFTHEHKDHIAGLDDVRAFNYLQQVPMPIYATERVQQALRREYHYAFGSERYPGVPDLALHTIDSQRFTVGQTSVIPITVMHYKLPVLGFRIRNFTYITDANYIEPQEIEKIRGTEVLVLNALRKEPHISHYTLDQAIAVAQEIGARQTYFTHISHLMGTHNVVDAELPSGMHLAYDGLVIELP
jgi:phosphoribosyl 1,2-cyclic phosphate phosphodiesterase